LSKQWVFSGDRISHEFLQALEPLLGQPNSVRLGKWAVYQANNLEELAMIKPIAQQYQLDLAPTDSNQSLADFKLLAMDMDSTLISIECVDEIADYCGKKAEVSAITEATMRGEISDFNESLRRRVALLAGLPVSALEQVYTNRLRLNPGAATLVEAAHNAGLKTLLVSGGFSFFTDRMQSQLKLSYTRSNTLEIIDNKLTGKLLGTIVNAQIKRETVQSISNELNINTDQVIAMGDGANDLEMMSIVGISVAYHAKPAVAAKASHIIEFGGLDTVLHWFEDARR
jgi:phosphoserine phosphatase